MGRYKVKVGEEFDISDAQVEPSEPESSSQIVELQRNRLAMMVLGIATLFLFGAAGLGLLENNFAKLEAVYGVAVIPVTVILTHYFKK